MRNGSRGLAALLLVVSLGTTRKSAEGTEAVERLRIRLPRAVPTLLRLPAATVARVRGAPQGVTVIAHRASASRVPGPGPDTSWVVLPEAARNRPAIVDVSSGAGTAEPRAAISRDGTRVERFRWDDDLVFGSVAGAKREVYDRALPHFYLAKLSPGGTAAIPVELPAPGPTPDARVTIRVALAATHEGLVQLSATWGARTFAPVAAVRTDTLATVSFACDGRDVPAAGTPFVLKDATTSVPPTTREDTSEDRGAVWVDSVELRVPIEAPGVPRTEVEEGLWVRLAELDAATLATGPADVPEPVERATGAEEVLLTTTATHAGATRLAAHRSSRGLRAVAIPFRDVVDRVGLGDPHPELVGRFLGALAQRGSPPRFLLLAGDADRDVGDDPATSIPTGYVRTIYNGATASDRALVRAGLPAGVRPPSVGRLPFRDAASMDAYVDRVIAYETNPPADVSRRTLRFVTSEGRFGPVVDTLLERLFTNVVATAIPPAYDVEVTFASATSTYLWPPARFNERVIEGLNAGALFHTYVGHGFAQGFDQLQVGSRRYPILRSEDVPRVRVAGTPPAMFVIACTTATFDDSAEVSVGERLVAQPLGPVAYWGATRVCHPAWNALVGREIALEMFADPTRRIGEILDTAAEGVLRPAPPPAGTDPMKDPRRRDRTLIEAGARSLIPGEVPLERLLEEGAWMYALLGDPALRIAVPRDDLFVSTSEEATPAGRSIRVTATGPIPDGATVALAVEVPRNVLVNRELPKDAAPEERQKARHASSNDKALARASAVASKGEASAVLVVPAAWAGRPLFAKAWVVAGGDVHQGAAAVPEK